LTYWADHPLLFQVLLPLLAPAVDVCALYGLLFLDPVRVLGLWLAFLLLQLGMGLYAFLLDGERPGPLWSLPLQQFVNRQLMYLVVIQSVCTAVSGSRPRWQRVERYGSPQAPVGTAAPRKDITPQEPAFPQPAPYDAHRRPAPYRPLPSQAPYDGWPRPQDSDPNP
jgi:hypothetical protein